MATDNVFITDESYYGPRGGFDVEDVLVPRRPNIDWFSTPPQVGGVSFAGGLGNQSGNQQSMNGLDLSGVQPMRQRRGLMEQAALRGIDAFDMISGVDKNAYLGKTLANEIAYEKALAEEDPEGKAADVNRAKILSQRAYATDDVELKKKYGAAIKRLLPQETQGLDDLAASEFFTGGEKMEIEKLKAATQLAKQKLANEGALAKTEKQNEGKITVQDMKNMSAESIANLKAETQKEIDMLDNAYKKAIADNKLDNAVQIQQMKSDLQMAVHNMDNFADYEREVLKQQEATKRTNLTQLGANLRNAENVEAKKYATDTKAKTALAVAALKPVGGASSGGGKLSKEERKENELVAYRAENFPEYVRQNQKNLDLINSSISALQQNPGASDKLTYLAEEYLGGLGVSSATQNAYGQINQAIAKVVQHIIQELNEAGATSSVFNSPEEQKTLIGKIKDPSAPYAERLAAFNQFKQQYEEYLRKEMDKTLWKAKRLGYPVQDIVGSYMQGNNNQNFYSKQLQAVAPAASLSGTKVSGGMEW